ncbi:ROK family protein [Staphylococcus caeli]|uniref:ROK family protein n=1 Tax=Staphylococcus caeli TaxID=2201815 RepID=UPI003F5708AF
MAKTKQQSENFKKIINELYTKRPISRIDISRNTDITAATVTDITSQLKAEHLISECGKNKIDENKNGRKKILLTVSDNHSHYIGIEFARDTINMSLTDNLGKEIDSQHIFLDKIYSEASQEIEQILKTIQNYIKSHESYDPKAIGIAIPGHYDAVEQKIATNNTFWNNFNLKELLSQIDLPIYLENNVHCMSIYEQYLSQNMYNPNFMFFHAAKGIFASNFYNGNLYGAQNFNVGEIGHTIVMPNGEQCQCGRRGCLQTFLGEEQLVNKAKMMYQQSNHTFLHSLVSSETEIQLSTIIDAYKMGDSGCIKIIEDAFNSVVITLNNLRMTLDIEKIYIHGPLLSHSDVNHLLFEFINYKKLFSEQQEIDIEIVPYSKKNGSLGACALAIRNYLIMSLPSSNNVDIET